LQPKLRFLLLEGLRTEEDSTNRQLLLWTISAYTYENIEYPELRDFPQNLSTTLASKISNSNWPTEDCLQALSVLSELTHVFSFVKSYNKETAPQLVRNLSSFIESSMEEKKAQVFPETLIVKSLYCILDW
jgi:hypothetical protein